MLSRPHWAKSPNSYPKSHQPSLFRNQDFLLWLDCHIGSVLVDLITSLNQGLVCSVTGCWIFDNQTSSPQPSQLCQADSRQPHPSSLSQHMAMMSEPPMAITRSTLANWFSKCTIWGHLFHSHAIGYACLPKPFLFFKGRTDFDRAMWIILAFLAATKNMFLSPCPD